MLVLCLNHDTFNLYYAHPISAIKSLAPTHTHTQLKKLYLGTRLPSIYQITVAPTSTLTTPDHSHIYLLPNNHYSYAPTNIHISSINTNTHNSSISMDSHNLNVPIHIHISKWSQRLHHLHTLINLRLLPSLVSLTFQRPHIFFTFPQSITIINSQWTLIHICHSTKTYTSHISKNTLNADIIVPLATLVSIFSNLQSTRTLTPLTSTTYSQCLHTQEN